MFAQVAIRHQIAQANHLWIGQAAWHVKNSGMYFVLHVWGSASGCVPRKLVVVRVPLFPIKRWNKSTCAGRWRPERVENAWKSLKPWDHEGWVYQPLGFAQVMDTSCPGHGRKGADEAEVRGRDWTDRLIGGCKTWSKVAWDQARFGIYWRWFWPINWAQHSPVFEWTSRLWADPNVQFPHLLQLSTSAPLQEVAKTKTYFKNSRRIFLCLFFGPAHRNWAPRTPEAPCPHPQSTRPSGLTTAPLRHKILPRQCQGGNKSHSQWVTRQGPMETLFGAKSLP